MIIFSKQENCDDLFQFIFARLGLIHRDFVHRTCSCILITGDETNISPCCWIFIWLFSYLGFADITANVRIDNKIYLADV